MAGTKKKLHVLIERENGVYNAVCLEMGLTAAGPDLDAVIDDMLAVIRAHVEHCLEQRRPQDIFVPAAPEEWLKYYGAARRPRKKVERRIRSFSTLPRLQAFNPASIDTSPEFLFA
jgi:hypothetical protein